MAELEASALQVTLLLAPGRCRAGLCSPEQGGKGYLPLRKMVTISVLLERKQVFSHLKMEENETEGKVGTPLGWRQPCSHARLAFRQERVLSIHI